jgi:hypothetical protein
MSSATIYHGGVVRLRSPANTPEASDVAAADRAAGEVADHVSALLEGRAPHMAPFVEVAPGAKVEQFSFFDADTGEYVVAWRVPCRHRRMPPGQH